MQLLLLLIEYFFIVYELDPRSRDLNSDFSLKGYSFGDINLAKNADLDKYLYGGCGIEFDSRSEFSLPDSSVSEEFE